MIDPAWTADGPILPDFADRCVTNIVPAILGGGSAAMPCLSPSVLAAQQVLLVVIDGMGWNQLQSRLDLTPTMAGFAGEPITTVAPSTTATALTSIATGTPPGEHGIVGYRIHVEGEVLNALRWTTQSGDARTSIVPDEFQPVDPFLAQRAAVVMSSAFRGSGFSLAHLAGADFIGCRTPASIVLETRRALAEGYPLVYAYYDGLDLIGHEYGHGAHYDAELTWVDRLIGDLHDTLPDGAAIVVTADHGQVVTTELTELHTDVQRMVRSQSGEARFRWLHCAPGSVAELGAAAREHHGDQAWVVPVDEMRDQRWFGQVVTAEAFDRLGQVALVAKGDVAFLDPADGGHLLRGRHGSLTPDEMLVPLLTARR